MFHKKLEIGHFNSVKLINFQKLHGANFYLSQEKLLFRSGNIKIFDVYYTVLPTEYCFSANRITRLSVSRLTFHKFFVEERNAKETEALRMMQMMLPCPRGQIIRKVCARVKGTLTIL